ncbi:putative carbonic anhydrase 5 [Hyposmocoma kahamanoa]|uniref:putative carbonic anhydrase 5 n=1 Tax=Hyposmocoma kahamanoa TaxID=1477025 RepID=UPI000E6D5EA3|nr:putative carbonic anhydrase 5 [Hyposmocoma kahamanoa]
MSMGPVKDPKPLKNVNAESSWNYEDQDSWEGECTTGKEQSPINLESAKAIRDDRGNFIKGPLVFMGYENVTVLAENNGHTLQWNVENRRQAPVVSGGPLRGNYSLLQFHLHWISEHAVDGRKYALEIHFVHIKAGLTMEEASMRPDGLAVVTTLCEVYSSTDKLIAAAYEYPLEEIMEQVPELRNSTGRLPPKNIDIRRLFSPRTQMYYTYHGSLTTPPCAEVVTWIVMDIPLIIADTQIKLIHETEIGGDSDNFRELQPTNRVVYRSRGNAFPANASVLLTTSLAWLASEMKKGICAVINKRKMFFGEMRKNCMEVTVKY